jgi:hypothetical protein
VSRAIVFLRNGCDFYQFSRRIAWPNVHVRAPDRETNMVNPRAHVIIAVIALSLSAAGLAQNKIAERNIVVDGHKRTATVFEIEGHSFIDLQELANLVPAIFQIHGKDLILTSPSLHENACSCSNQQSTDAGMEMSQDFMSAVSDALGYIHEWRTVLSSALGKGAPGDGSNLGRWEAKATEAVRLASIAESTDADRAVFALLSNDLNHMRSWHNKMVSARKSMNTADYSMAEDKLSRDVEFQKVVKCSDLLANVISTRKMSDDGSCR